jgi:hypothetical protein
VRGLFAPLRAASRPENPRVGGSIPSLAIRRNSALSHLVLESGHLGRGGRFCRKYLKGAAWAYIHQPDNAAKYTDEEVRTIRVRIRRAAKARQVALPDPDEFVELMARVRKKRKEK